MSEERQEEDTRKPLFTLSIELGDQKKKLLNVYEGTRPEQLAYDFCLQNNLDFESMQNLTEEIKTALQTYYEPGENEDPAQNNEQKIENEEEGEEEENLKEDDNKDKESKEEDNKSEEKSEHEKSEHEKSEHEKSEHEKSEHEKSEHEKSIHEKSGHEKSEHEKIEIEKSEPEKKNDNIINKEDIPIKLEQKEEIVIKENDKKEDNMISQPSEHSEHKITEHDVENNQNEKIEENFDINKKKEEQNEEEIEKEEEIDKVGDINEDNEEEEEDEKEEEVNYLTSTISCKNKQSQKVVSKPKSEYKDFDTRFKKIDKAEEFSKSIKEEVVNNLQIYKNNQKYLPKDYYDNPENKNFGERLYQREMRLKEEAMEKVKKKIKEEKKEEESNLVFVPQINEINIAYLQKRKLNKMEFNDEKRIKNYKDYLKSRDEKLQKKLYDDMEKDNTFNPKIDANSQRIIASKKRIPLKDQDVQFITKKLESIKKLEDKIYDKKNLFKPKINKNYRKSKNKNNKTEDYASLTFEERQKKFLQRKEENKDLLTKQKNINLEPNSEKAFFKPSINKYKNLEIQRKNKPIFNELYLDSEKYQIKKEQLVKKVKELEHYNTEFKASIKSEEMYDKKKDHAFEKLFENLDNDKDDKISSSQINLTGISKRIIKVLTPIINNLKAGKVYNQEEFIDECYKIYDKLNYADKKELYIYTIGGVGRSIYDPEPYLNLRQKLKSQKKRKQKQRKQK